MPFLKILSLTFILFIILSFRCKDDGQELCAGLTPPRAEFGFKEVLSDTAFFADTVYRDNSVSFVALRSYTTVNWKIGDDPRTFTNNTFSLNFPSELGALNVSFTGTASPNSNCFPGDNGIYPASRSITFVEQVQKPLLTISPLVGSYRGAFNTQPNDIFTVRIQYFDSAKYDAGLMGSKNFYWISNIPKNYVDSTSEPARQYPELCNGMRPEMGYKCLAFGDASNMLTGKGFAELVNENTLKIYYQHPTGGRKIFTGKKL